MGSRVRPENYGKVNLYWILDTKLRCTNNLNYSNIFLEKKKKKKFPRGSGLSRAPCQALHFSRRKKQDFFFLKCLSFFRQKQH